MRSISQALLSECGSDVLGQGCKLRGLEQVDASGRGDVAEPPGGCHAGPARGLRDDLGPMVHTGLRVLSEVQLLAVNLDVSTSRYVVSVVKRTDFSLGLFFEIQFHALNFHTPTTWPVADVLQGAAFGGHMTQVYLLGNNLHLSPFRLVFDVVSRSNFGFDILQVWQWLVNKSKLLGSRGRFWRRTYNGDFLLTGHQDGRLGGSWCVRGPGIARGSRSAWCA